MDRLLRCLLMGGKGYQTTSESTSQRPDRCDSLSAVKETSKSRAHTQLCAEQGLQSP